MAYLRHIREMTLFGNGNLGCGARTKNGKRAIMLHAVGGKVVEVECENTFQRETFRQSLRCDLDAITVRQPVAIAVEDHRGGDFPFQGKFQVGVDCALDTVVVFPFVQPDCQRLMPSYRDDLQPVVPKTMNFQGRRDENDTILNGVSA